MLLLHTECSYSLTSDGSTHGTSSKSVLLERQQKHNSTVYVFSLVLGSYMFQHHHHPQGVYTNISLEVQQYIIYNKRTFVLTSVVQFWLKLCVCVYIYI